MLTESSARASYLTTVQKRSSLLVEFGWLAYFLAIFAILVYVFNIFVVPHHFNDRIAVLIAAIVAGLAMIVTRSMYMRRSP